MRARPVPPRPGFRHGAGRRAEILRVDHAGELAAVFIYRGQRAVFSRATDKARITGQLEQMQAHEAEHLAAFNERLTADQVRPTLFAPVWRAAAFALGAATALMGEKAAHACTEAVESVIEGHYADQVDEIEAREPALAAELSHFRDEELAHHDLAVAEGARDAPGYPLLTSVIKAGCRAAIRISEKLSEPVDVDQMRRDAERPVKADAASADAACRDLADAFHDDPLFNWFSRTDARRDAARLRFFRHLMREEILKVGETLRPASGGAAAVWMRSETLAPGRNPLLQELQALPMLLGMTGLSRFRRLAQLRKVMDRAHPMDRPHAYLWFLGVAPAAQGHGVGSRLLKARLDQLDREGRPAFLETATERNLSFYRRHGFNVISDYRPGADGPMIWAMWREAPDGGG